MTECQASRDEWKRKIRKFKKLEIKIRFGHLDAAYMRNKGTWTDQSDVPLVWDEFFDLHESGAKTVKYPMRRLSEMDKDAFMEVVGEFFYHVYRRMYEDSGLSFVDAYDPEILAQMGLRYDADSTSIKKKFRELAKKHHPDTGGDSAGFIELMEKYKRLIDG